ncbi:D-methionine transport system ATP-binding protein [Anaerobranca californiensis DSM 14826]|jgi:D-methionine transport system ATP-binding protein|uniref:D-methionine transport system ATP-binding protein n=1 Tax=Anaerobranca californiensis DSM 14826 TaxID=1120989 RepID=A0A1M6MHQ2_9FIRM|nr:ATP-binding cassette domain-containing protein [Anaerobranca californiensis]SHJ83031.1 D-methionine transport system ATP-binding protein [Anaerobranca californiensis DSM 14826]
MLEVKNLNKTFPNGKERIQALKDINLKVEKGEIFGIIGLSGAGKSTLIRTLNLLEPPDSGTVEIDGKNIVEFTEKELREVRREIGMIFQNFNLLSSLTVYENVELPLKIAKKKDRKDRVTELLRLVGLEDKANCYPSQLSGGQKQRVGIARALANNPKILLCDEPTSALDPVTTKSILNLLKEINEKFSLTTVIITHDMGVIKNLCNKVAVISGGELVEKGEVFEVFTNPKSYVTKELLLENDFIDKTQKDYYHSNGIKYLNLQFNGEEATQPIISRGLRKIQGVELNILKGVIEDINGKKLGRLLVELTGEEQYQREFIDYLKENAVLVEVL